MSNILHAIYKATATLLAPTANAPAPLESDAQGALWTSQATLIAGEDLTNNRLLNMPKYSYLAAVVADAQVKAGSGVLHTITMSSDAAATAGTLILYDSLTEAGTIILTINFVAAFLVPVTLIFDCDFATGLYLGFATTADVSVSCTYL